MISRSVTLKDNIDRTIKYRDISMAAPLIVYAGYVLAGASAAGVTYVIGKRQGKSEGYKKGKTAGEAKVKAQYKSQVDTANARMAKFKEEVDGYTEFYNTFLTLTALGVAAISCKTKNISSNELEEIKEIAMGMMIHNIPVKVQSKISLFKDVPPDIDTAFKMVDSLNLTEFQEFDDMVALAMVIRGVPTKAGLTFQKNWRQFKKYGSYDKYAESLVKKNPDNKENGNVEEVTNGGTIQFISVDCSKIRRNRFQPKKHRRWA